MKQLIKYPLLAAALLLASCSDSKTSTLSLEGDTRVEAITVSGYEGVIDHTPRTISVNVPADFDLSVMKVDAISLSEGASCSLPAGTVFNATVPRSITVTNGDVQSVYTMSVVHDNVEFLSFTLDGQYHGTIDNSARTILVFVPLDAYVSAMQATFTVNAGAVVTPGSGAVLDFSEPVVLKAVCRTATADYTVTVVKDEMSQAPKAFVGTASDAYSLGDEASAACRWMLENVPNSRYVSVQQIIDGDVKLDDFTMVWCHFDFTDWPGQMWDSRDHFNAYWLRGGNILASRDGARYINDVWRIARDQQSPNNMFGGDSYETLAYDLGFTITGHEDHAIYAGLPTDADGRVLLVGAGCANSNRTLQWGADWDPYGSPEGWAERTGAKALASGHDYDVNRVTIAEFEPYEALKGYQSGTVITIGTPAYEWYNPNGVPNPYYENIVALTKNSINYLCK